MTNSFESMLPPIQHLEYCEFNKYSLQLHIYKHLLEKHYFVDVESLFMVQIHPNQSSYVEIEARDVSVEAALLLKSVDNTISAI